MFNSTLAPLYSNAGGTDSRRPEIRQATRRLRRNLASNQPSVEVESSELEKLSKEIALVEKVSAMNYLSVWLHQDEGRCFRLAGKHKLEISFRERVVEVRRGSSVGVFEAYANYDGNPAKAACVAILKTIQGDS